MRKVLANIVKDVTPRAGMSNPLSESTIQDIRDCFGIISEREAELARELGFSAQEKPYYTDQPQKSTVVKFHRSSKGKKTKPD